jgi:hypothetical protein
VGAASVAVLLALGRFAPTVPATLGVLALAVCSSSSGVGSTLPIRAMPRLAKGSSTDAHGVKRELIRPCSTRTLGASSRRGWRDIIRSG